MPILQAWVAIAEQIDCPAPLPEDPESPLLTKMLFPAPYEVPEKKAKKTAAGTRDGLRRKVAPDMTSEDTETHSSPEDDEEEEEIHPPYWGEKEEEGLHTWGGRGVQEGKNLPSELLRRSHQQRRGVGAQGQAPGQIVSIRTR